MTRLGIDICSLAAFDNVRHPPVTGLIGIVLMYQSDVEVEVDLLVRDACDLELDFDRSLVWEKLGK